MTPSDFFSELAGKPARTLGGYWAFIPANLPPPITYTPSLVRLLSEADAALGELSGLGRYLPNPDLLILPYMRQEAVASSRIEGTHATVSDLLLDEMSPDKTAPESDVIEVRNYVTALSRGISLLNTLPLSGRMVRELHAVLMREVRGDELTPGEFRRSQNWIGKPGCTLAEATYVPPPHDVEMHECLSHWEKFMNERGQMPELIQCALIHEHFEAIHPFVDGNGRIGRLLITLFLIERGRLSKPLLYLSNYIEEHRSEYYALLKHIRTHGDWTGWFEYFLTAVRDTARSAIKQSEAILKVRDRFRKQLKKQPRELMLLDELFLNPYTSIARVAMQLAVSPPTAAKVINSLEKSGLLKKVGKGRWGRIWLAEPILDAATAPNKST